MARTEDNGKRDAVDATVPEWSDGESLVKDDLERRAMEAARRLLTTPKPAKGKEPKPAVPGRTAGQPRKGRGHKPG